MIWDTIRSRWVRVNIGNNFCLCVIPYQLFFMIFFHLFNLYPPDKKVWTITWFFLRNIFYEKLFDNNLNILNITNEFLDTVDNILYRTCFFIQISDMNIVLRNDFTILKIGNDILDITTYWSWCVCIYHIEYCLYVKV